MVEAVARGAAGEPTIRVRLLAAPVAQAADLLEADGYIFGAPENLAAIAGLICAGRDGHNAARQVARIATGWRLKAMADPLIVCTHAQTPEAILTPKVISPDDLKRCEELGAALAAGMSMGVF